MKLFKKPQPANEKEQPVPEKLKYMRYYEHDGALRAYANRAMMLAFLCIPTTLVAVGLAAYVRLQPPTVIRVDQNGEAAVLGQKSATDSLVNVSQGASAEPNDFEKKSFMKLFLDHYLSFSPENVNRNWSEAVNLMSSNLRRATLNAMEKDNTVGKIQDDQITSVFHLRSKPLRHLIGVSEELSSATSGNAGRTLLAASNPEFLWTSLAHIHGLPGIPEWAPWFHRQLTVRHALRPLLGIGCEPVLVRGRKQDFLDWMREGIEAGELRFPEKCGPVQWPNLNLSHILQQPSALV